MDNHNIKSKTNYRQAQEENHINAEKQTNKQQSNNNNNNNNNNEGKICLCAKPIKHYAMKTYGEVHV
jgi:hypothetical protein